MTETQLKEKADRRFNTYFGQIDRNLVWERRSTFIVIYSKDCDGELEELGFFKSWEHAFQDERVMRLSEDQPKSDYSDFGGI